MFPKEQKSKVRWRWHRVLFTLEFWWTLSRTRVRTFGKLNFSNLKKLIRFLNSFTSQHWCKISHPLPFSQTTALLIIARVIKLIFWDPRKKQLLHLVTPWLSPICTLNLTEHCTDKSAFGRRDCLPAINAMETMPQHGSILPEDSPVKI